MRLANFPLSSGFHHNDFLPSLTRKNGWPDNKVIPNLVKILYIQVCDEIISSQNSSPHLDNSWCVWHHIQKPVKQHPIETEFKYKECHNEMRPHSHTNLPILITRDILTPQHHYIKSNPNIHLIIVLKAFKMYLCAVERQGKKGTLEEEVCQDNARIQKEKKTFNFEVLIVPLCSNKISVRIHTWFGFVTILLQLNGSFQVGSRWDLKLNYHPAQITYKKSTYMVGPWGCQKYYPFANSQSESEQKIAQKRLEGLNPGLVK